MSSLSLRDSASRNSASAAPTSVPAIHSIWVAPILAGLLARWSWVRNRKFRIIHLAAIAVVVLQAWLGRLCPLTIWENELRRLAGQPPYSQTFVEHWLHEILFYQAPSWVFTAIYTGFGLLVLLTWFLGRRVD